jgi:hypothetical protein
MVSGAHGLTLVLVSQLPLEEKFKQGTGLVLTQPRPMEDILAPVRTLKKNVAPVAQLFTKVHFFVQLGFTSATSLWTRKLL